MPKHLLLLMHHAPPDASPNAKFALDVAAEMQNHGWRVEVWAAMAAHSGTAAIPDNIRIRRFWHPRFNRQSVLGRTINSFFVNLFCFWRLLFNKQPTLILADTSSVFIGLTAYLNSVFSKTPYVYSATEIYPDVAIALGNLGEHNLLSKIWRQLNRRVYRRASAVRVIGEAEKKFAGRYCGTNLEPKVVADWADIQPPRSFSVRDQQISKRRRWGDDRIVIMYAGSVGRVHDLAALIAIARGLEHESDFHFVFMGHKPAVVGKDSRLANATFLGFQPSSNLPDLLLAADFCAIPLKAKVGGLVTPSRIYNALAAGQALFALAEGETTITKLIQKHKLGIFARNDQPLDMARQLRELAANRDLLGQLRLNAYNYALKNGLAEHQIPKYTQLLEGIA